MPTLTLVAIAHEVMNSWPQLLIRLRLSDDQDKSGYYRATSI